MDRKEPCRRKHTDDHDIEVESLSHTFAMPLVRQVGEADIASQFSPDHVSHVICCGGSSFGIF